MSALFATVLRAAKDNDVRTMTRILQEEPAAARAANGINQTALHVAAIWGNVDVAILLIDAGADINAMNQFGATPLSSAVNSDRLEITKLLLDERANPTIGAPDGLQLADIAKSDAMRELVGAPPLKGHAALLAGDTEALETLLVSGELDLSHQDTSGDTVLHLAVTVAVGDGSIPEANAASSHPAPGVTSPTLAVLLAHQKGALGWTTAQRLHNKAGLMPLHLAARRGSAAVCEALLKATKPRGLINAVALQTDSLHNGQWGKKNAAGEIERLSAAGSTALHLAVQELHDRKEAAEDDGEEDVTLDAGCVRLLLARHADPNAVDGDEQTPLHIAIMGGLHEVVALLCEANADLSLGCKPFGKNNTALHQATITRDVPMIKLLAAHGADVDAPGRDGWTPLCMAVRSNAVPTATALLEAKANVLAQAGNGKTALEIATVNNGKKELVELLHEAARAASTPA